MNLIRCKSILHGLTSGRRGLIDRAGDTILGGVTGLGRLGMSEWCRNPSSREARGGPLRQSLYKHPCDLVLMISAMTEASHELY